MLNPKPSKQHCRQAAACSDNASTGGSSSSMLDVCTAALHSHMAILALQHQLLLLLLLLRLPHIMPKNASIAGTSTSLCGMNPRPQFSSAGTLLPAATTAVADGNALLKRLDYLQPTLPHVAAASAAAAAWSAAHQPKKPVRCWHIRITLWHKTQAA
jgi:hypothetical protein